jgi:hypothetical protein
MSAAQKSEIIAFYEKLLRALEFGERKAETELLAALFPSGPPDSFAAALAWLAENKEPAEVMAWLVSALGSFADMLSEIYTWLADARATVGGNVDEVRFDFQKLNEQVPFSLESFPKTYVRALGDVTQLIARFEPGARGFLRVDTPDYWREAVPALENLTRSMVLQPNVFALLPVPNQHAVAFRVRRLVATLEAEYLRRTRPPSLERHWQFSEVMFFASAADWARALELAERPGATSGTANYDSSNELHEYMRQGYESGRIAHGTELLRLLEEIERLALGVHDPPRDRLVFTENLQADDTYAFLCAYETCFVPHEHTVEGYIEVVDQVLLPFWRHRWRLFEVWSILWLSNVLPESVRPAPCLVPREGDERAFDWVLAGGEARSPVAASKLNGRELSLWFQLKTPLDAEDATRFKQEHIEPDVRLREMPAKPGAQERDLAILELKDRYLAGGSSERDVARMYATTGAPVVCVANYSPFRAKTLHGQLYREQAGSTSIFLVDEFRPGSTPEQVERAIREAIGIPTIDVLMDVSSSMDAGLVPLTLDLLPSHTRTEARWFRWAGSFEMVADEAAAVTGFAGGTNLEQAIEAHQDLADPRRGLIITDADGLAQFESLCQAGRVERSRYLCLDVALPGKDREVDIWLGLQPDPSEIAKARQALLKKRAREHNIPPAG